LQLSLYFYFSIHCYMFVFAQDVISYIFFDFL